MSFPETTSPMLLSGVMAPHKQLDSNPPAVKHKLLDPPSPPPVAGNPHRPNRDFWRFFFAWAIVFVLNTVFLRLVEVDTLLRAMGVSVVTSTVKTGGFFAATSLFDGWWPK